MVRRVITEVASQQIVDGAHYVIRRFEVIINIQARMVAVRYLGSEKQADHHR